MKGSCSFKAKEEVSFDANWAGSITDRRSTSGYLRLVGGNLVNVKTKTKSVVARSSAEAEFRAMANAICELLWLRGFLQERRLQFDNYLRLYCDNKAAINIAHNTVWVVNRRCRFLREEIKKGICTEHRPNLEIFSIDTLSMPKFLLNRRDRRKLENKIFRKSIEITGLRVHVGSLNTNSRTSTPLASTDSYYNLCLVDD